MKETLALHIIAKDEKEQLQRIIDNYEKYFDEIVIAYDREEAIENLVVGYKVSLHKYEWCDDFAHKRNFLASKTKSNYYVRMDTDDDILNPENIKPLFERMVLKSADVILCPYLYSFDDDGNCNAKHWRETFVRKSVNFYWNKPVHENIFAENAEQYKIVNDASVVIKHNITIDHIENSGRRNFKILIKEFNKDKEKTDPRTVAYLGRMLLSFGEYDKAIQFLKLLIENSGWDDDRYFAWIDMAHCYQNTDKLELAIACCNEALAIKTDFPDAYNTLGEIHVNKQEYGKAVDWLKIGIKKGEPNTHYVVDPSNYIVKAPMILAIALFGQGYYEAAYQVYQKVYAIAPNHPIVSSQKEVFEQAYENDQYLNHLFWVYTYTKAKDKDKVVDLVKSIPTEMYQDERIYKLRHKHLPAKKWSDKSVVFYCGSSWEDWSAPSVIKGIGGSEEAVIYIAKEFVELGYEVTVFNNCGDLAGTYEGVTYKHYYEFNHHDDYNVVICWRRNMFVEGIKVRKRILWLHDVPFPELFNGNYNFDTVLVLSEYQKSLLPKDIPEEKIFVTSNGINLKDFENINVKREPHRLIYSSSYDRGIENLLEVWGDVRKEVPDAELHMFYGWAVYDKLAEEGRRDTTFKDRMLKLMDQPGIFEHGRIGHKKLNKEFAKANFWVYPCHFEEISCITAMKVQALDCIPVCTDYGALSETVKHGVITKGQANDKDVKEAYKNSLISILKNDSKQKEIREKLRTIKDQFGWDKVANEWSEKVFNAPHYVRKYEDDSDYIKQYSGYHLKEKKRREFRPGNFIKGQPVLQEKMRLVIEESIERDCKTLLDIGSNDGSLCFLADDAGIKSSGLEIDPRAKTFGDGLKTDCTFYTGIYENFEPGETYDTVCALEVLEHVRNPQEFLDKMYGMSNKLLVLSVPHKDGFYGKSNTDPLHINWFNEEDLAKLCNGKKVVRNERVGDLIYLVIEK